MFIIEKRYIKKLQCDGKIANRIISDGIQWCIVLYTAKSSYGTTSYRFETLIPFYGLHLLNFRNVNIT